MTKERKLAESVIRAVSDPNFSLAVFADAVINQHPTHQQTLGRAIFSVIEKWHENYVTGYFDARNEGTVSASYTMWSALDGVKPYQPYV